MILLVGCLGYNAAVNANGPFLAFGIGLGLSDVGKAQTYSPELGLVNKYDFNDKIKTVGPLLKVELGYVFAINRDNAIALGVEGAYLDYGTTSGILRRGINISSDLNTLNYSFDSQSYLLLAKSKLLFRKNFWLPHIALGVGASFNRLGNYSETSTSPAASSPHIFQDNTKRDLAVLAEIGICQFKADKHLDVNLGYNFIYAGSKNALKNPVSGEDSIGAGGLKAHLIVISAKFHNIV